MTRLARTSRTPGPRATTLLAACLAAISVAQSQAAPDRGPAAAVAPTVEVTHGHWYMNGRFVDSSFYIVDGVLRAQRPARVDSEIDLQGGYVIPPFGDAHTHNLDGPFNLDKVRDAYIKEGTFYVAVLTNSATGADRVKSRFNQACDLDVIYANGGLTSTLSHPFLAYEPRAMRLFGDWGPHAAEIRKSRLRENDAYWFLDSRADLDAKWPRILAAHPGIIKIFLLDAQEHPPAMSDSGLPSGHGLRPSLVPEIVKRAHAAGLRVAAHVETAADFAVAVNAGVDQMAHLPGYALGTDPSGKAQLGVSAAPFEVSADIAKKAGRARLTVTPTVAWTYTGGGPDSAAAVPVRQALMKRNIDALSSAGVQFIVGSDWFGATASHEIAAMRALGAWSDSTVLQMWMRTPSAIFPARKIGRLEDGYEASFLVLKDNPLQRFDAVQDIRLRVKQGCVLKDTGAP
ncbi:MAG: hypothetical protein U0132_08480 [Gemmatimonadaceae bacterium]